MTINNAYLGYWNLDECYIWGMRRLTQTFQKRIIVFNFDAGTVDNYITGGNFDDMQAPVRLIIRIPSQGL